MGHELFIERKSAVFNDKMGSQSSDSHIRNGLKRQGPTSPQYYRGTRSSLRYHVSPGHEVAFVQERNQSGYWVFLVCIYSGIGYPEKNYVQISLIYPTCSLPSLSYNNYHLHSLTTSLSCICPPRPSFLPFPSL